MPAFSDAQSILLNIAIRILAALIIYVIGRWLARRGRRWTEGLVERTQVTDYLEQLAVRAVYYGILGVTILIVLAVLGVPAATLVTTVGIALVLLGIALQESISNLAATVIFFVFQPFEVGDYIETGGVEGTVAEIQLFSTVLHQGNGTVAILPNGKIQTDGLSNYSKMPRLRADVNVGIDYDDDVETAREVALRLMRADERILSEPAPQIVVTELGDSSVKLSLRPFVREEDFWAVRQDLNEQILGAFPAAGLSLPYPQLDVHVAGGTEEPNTQQ